MGDGGLVIPVYALRCPFLSVDQRGRSITPVAAD
jgi:hypothetical protein